MRFRYVLYLIVTIASANGCATVADYRYAYSQKWLAWTAWHSAKDNIPEQMICRDFGKGYRAGFLDVARGGDGTPPPVAPKEYWTPRYNDCNGCSGAIDVWYEGFSRGAHDAYLGNYRNCYNVPSHANCVCSNGEDVCGLETNQVVNSAIEAGIKRHDPSPDQSQQQSNSNLNPVHPPAAEAIEPKSEELQNPSEVIPLQSVQPQDGL